MAGGSYTWKLYTAQIAGDKKIYGLSTARKHYKGGTGLAIATMGWSAIATARPNHWLRIGDYDGRWNKDGALEIQFTDEKGKLTHQTFKVESEEITPTPSLPTAEQAATQAIPPKSAEAHQSSAATFEDSGTCNVTCAPNGAEISVNGSFVGNTPSVLSLTPGRHSIVVSARGFRDWRKELTINRGSAVSLAATLESERY